MRRVSVGCQPVWVGVTPSSKAGPSSGDGSPPFYPTDQREEGICQREPMYNAFGVEILGDKCLRGRSEPGAVLFHAFGVPSPHREAV